MAHLSQQLNSKKLIIYFALLCSIPFVNGQGNPNSFYIPTTNPLAEVKQRIAATDIEITYHRPTLKGRVIFGDLVPYNQIWRTGADAATRISFSTPVIIQNKEIEAGEYELFSIPDTNTWEIILQKAQNQWGSYKYMVENDVERFTVPVDRLENRVESFTISIDDISSSSGTLHIAWEHIFVGLEISINIRKWVLPQLEEALKGEGKKPYFLAAMYYFENDLDIERSAELMIKAVEERPNHLGMLYRLALILERKGDVAGAIQAAQKSLAETSKVGDELKMEYTKLNTSLLSRLQSQLSNDDYNHEMIVDVQIEKVFLAITNDVSKWWINNATITNEVGDTLKLGINGTYKVFLITECELNKRVVWKCTDVFLNIPTIEDKREWVGTEIIWDLTKVDSGTKIRLNHRGLSPELECFTICQPTWDYFLEESLSLFLTTGIGKPLIEKE